MRNKMKKFIFFVLCIISFGIGTASADNTVVIVADDIDLFYWDRAYNSFLAYYEYKADADYKIGEINDALWYYEAISYFYPTYYKGWWGIIRCYSKDFTDFDFEDSETYVAKLKKCEATEESKTVLKAFDKQWPDVLKKRKERDAEIARKRADNLYNMKFVRSNGVLTQYNGSDETVVLPDDVTAIGDGAFRQSGIKSIVFPKNIKTIGKNAFANCAALQTVVIPHTVETIGTGAFRQCGNLVSVTVQTRIDELPDNIFQGCSKLKQVTLAEGIKKIGKSFVGCDSLDSMIIPKSVVRIGDFAFSSCSNLKNIVLLNRKVEIGKRAFYGTSIINKRELAEAYGDAVFY